MPDITSASPFISESSRNYNSSDDSTPDITHDTAMSDADNEDAIGEETNDVKGDDDEPQLESPMKIEIYPCRICYKFGAEMALMKHVGVCEKPENKDSVPPSSGMSQTISADPIPEPSSDFDLQRKKTSTGMGQGLRADPERETSSDSDSEGPDGDDEEDNPNDTIAISDNEELDTNESAVSVQIHLEESDEEMEMFVCKMCNKLFDEEAALDKHLKHYKMARGKENSQEAEHKLLKKNFLEYRYAECERFFMKEGSTTLKEQMDDGQNNDHQVEKGSRKKVELDNFGDERTHGNTSEAKGQTGSNRTQNDHKNLNITAERTENEEIRKKESQKGLENADIVEKDNNEKQMGESTVQIEESREILEDQNYVVEDDEGDDHDLCTKVEKLAVEQEQIQLQGNISTFTCETYKKQFSYKRNFEKHCLNCRNAKQKAPVATTNPTSELGIFENLTDKHFIGPTSTICHMQFSSDFLLTKHMQESHAPKVRALELPFVTFECTNCKKSFVSLCQFKLHLCTTVVQDQSGETP